MTKTFWIQVVLIVGIVAVALRLLAGTGQRTQAVRRLGLLAFAALAALSVLFPTLWTRVAHLVGIGRGTDLVLYLLVIAFFSFVATMFRRQREAEQRYTQLARKVALSEAPPAGLQRPLEPPVPSDDEDQFL
ncbi:MAG: DUF2304 domain-containing protein [Marmoricola sp.]